LSLSPLSVRWEAETLLLLDQTQLPHAVVYETLSTRQQVFDAIRGMKVRGAPAIGITAAYGLVVALRANRDLSAENFMQQLRANVDFLSSARPTAVNLFWALNRLARVAELERNQNPEASAIDLWNLLVREAECIHQEDREICAAIARHGQALITPGCGVLTHCNAGSLAVSERGTATAPMYAAHEAGVSFRVYADETRPLLQGARLTAWELSEAGIDVRLICDNMAAYFMAQGDIDLVIVGTDRVAANGDVVNKIGTSGVAILCRHFSIPFYVACPSSTFDSQTETGTDVEIEQRSPDEVRNLNGQGVAPAGVTALNPAFDVTPVQLVSGFITDKGLLRPPFPETLGVLSS